MTFKHNNKDYELISLVLSGSRMYGNSTPESDWDYRGIFIESVQDKVGILPQCNQISDGTMLLKTLNELGLNLEDTDDIVLYELNTFTKLAIDNNPNIMDLLHADDESIVYMSEKGRLLRDNSSLFLSSKMKFTFSGYAISQLKRIQGHNKMITKYPYINEVVQFLKDEYTKGTATKEQIDDMFGKNAFDCVKNCESHVGESVEYNLKDYTKPEFLDFCNAYDLKHKKIEFNPYFLKHEASFRKISQSVIAVYTDGNGIISKENNIKQNDPEHIGEFMYLLKIDQMNYKKECDAIANLWKWKAGRNVKRNELEVEYGYDTKHASHLVRLMRQCIKILENGVYSPRLQGIDLQEIKDVRKGFYSYEEIIKLAKDLDARCDELYKTTKLRKKPDTKVINDLVLKMQLVQEK